MGNQEYDLWWEVILEKKGVHDFLLFLSVEDHPTGYAQKVHFILPYSDLLHDALPTAFPCFITSFMHF
jgi:hypothetical protein